MKGRRAKERPLLPWAATRAAGETGSIDPIGQPNHTTTESAAQATDPAARAIAMAEEARLLAACSKAAGDRDSFWGWRRRMLQFQAEAWAEGVRP